MTRPVLIAIAAGAVSGLIFAAPLLTASLGMIVLNYFTQAPLYLAGLALGVSAALIAGASGTVIAGLALGPWDALQYALAFAVPVAAVVRQALLWRQDASGTVHWYPSGRLVALLTIYGAAAFVALFVYVAAQGESLGALIEQALTSVLAQLMSEADATVREAAAARWAPLVPAMVIDSWLLMAVVNGVLAQLVLAKWGRSRRPTPRFSAFSVPTGFDAALAAAAALWLFADGDLALAGATLALVLVVPFVLQGLAVVHAISRGWRGRGFALAAFYVLVLFVLGPMGMVLVAGLGLVEQWAGLRRRAAGGPGKEDE